MTVIAFIPARIGSTRLPRKNLRTVGGVTLIGRAVDCALQAGGGTWRIVVSVDHPDLLAAAQERWNGVEYHHQRTASDTSQIEQAMLDWTESQTSRVASGNDVIVMMQPTSPLRRHEHAWLCAEAVGGGRWDSALTYTADPHAYFGGESIGLTWVPLLAAGQERPRTQDLLGYGYENGACYATTIRALTVTRSRTSGCVCGIPMDSWDAIDVDTERDLDMANWIESRLYSTATVESEATVACALPALHGRVTA